jgi:serine/threonine-protein kinase
MSLLAKDPLARPATAAEVAAAARALRADPADAAEATKTRLLSLGDAATTPVAVPPDAVEPAAEVGRPRWRSDAYPGQRRARGLLLLAGLAVVVVGALLLVLVGGNGGNGGKAAAKSSPSPTATSRPTPPSLSLVASRYSGRKYPDVSAELAALGLTVQRRTQASSLPPDTVIGIAPTGSVPVGSTVIVTVAAPQPPDDHGKHHGPGKGHDG